MDGGGVDARHPVGEADVAGAALLRRLHQAHDLGEERILAHGRHPGADGRGQVEGPGVQQRARRDVGGQALAGHQAGIDRASALDDSAIGRHALPRRHRDDHAGCEVRDGHGADPAARPHDQRRHAGEADQVLGREARPRPRPAVQIAADEEEEEQPHRGVEIGVRAAGDGLLQAHAGGEDDGEGDGHVHVEGAGAQGREGRAEEGLPGIGHGGKRDQGRDPVEHGACRLAHAAPVAGPDRDREQHHIGGGEAGHGEGHEEAPLLARARLAQARGVVGRRGVAERLQPAEEGAGCSY